uniref:Fibrinogen C-terminal domain-containing protein n=1 Tax=Panagrellus redivivus TaxID=6233 RepID=A0A7E4UT68_PANRE
MSATVNLLTVLFDCDVSYPGYITRQVISRSAIMAVIFGTLSLCILAFLVGFVIADGTVSCEKGWDWSPTFKQCLRVQDDKLNFADAEADCVKYGAKLVSLVSAFEEDDLINIINRHGHCDYYWLGATRPTIKDKFTWVDGKPFDYTHFGPKDYNNTLNCVDIRAASSNWHTEGCEKHNCFVCAKDDAATPSPTKYADCGEILEAGIKDSGVYTVTLGGDEFQVYCDMTTESGGWTVIQQRLNADLEFWNQNWQNYRNGFGVYGDQSNFWAGNELIHRLTTKNPKTILRIDLWGDRAPNSPHKDDYYWGEYIFSIGAESDDYPLNVQTWMQSPNDWDGTGNASSAWYDIIDSNGVKFSTVDHINDPMSKCVTDYHLGGWWLRYCTTATLNGEYVPLKYSDGYGFMWMVDGTYVINPVKSRMAVKKAWK